VDQVETKTGTEDKVEELDQTVKIIKECYGNMNGTCKISGTP
jgi:hypothetical protein